MERVERPALAESAHRCALCARRLAATSPENQQTHHHEHQNHQENPAASACDEGHRGNQGRAHDGVGRPEGILHATDRHASPVHQRAIRLQRDGDDDFGNHRQPAKKRRPDDDRRVERPLRDRRPREIRQIFDAHRRKRPQPRECHQLH